MQRCMLVVSWMRQAHQDTVRTVGAMNRDRCKIQWEFRERSSFLLLCMRE